MEKFHIATRDLAEKDRVPIMRDFYGRIAMGVDIDPVPEAHFEMEISTMLLPSVGLGRGVISPIKATRGRHLAQDGNSGLLFSAFSETFHVSDRHADRVAVMPGQVLAAPLDLASDWTYQRVGDVTSVWIDRERLALLVPKFRPDRVTVLDLASPMVGLLFAYARTVREIAAPTRAELELFDRHLLEIAAMAVAGFSQPQEAGASAGVRAARLAALKKDIGVLFQRQDLSVGELGRRHGVTPRYVQLLFEGEGTTFTEHLQATRLDFAARRLADPRYDRMRVADIAFEAGFTDLSTFNRLFRRRFGDTPSGMRAGR